MTQIIPLSVDFFVGEELTFPEDNPNPNMKLITGVFKESGCLECTSHIPVEGGYPQCDRNGKRLNISRLFAWRYLTGFSGNMVVMHICDNPICINPDHLRIGTQQENIADKVAKGRQPRGSQINTSILTEGEVYFIRFLSDEENNLLAEMFGVKESTIEAVKKGRGWEHVTIDSKWRNDDVA